MRGSLGAPRALRGRRRSRFTVAVLPSLLVLGAALAACSSSSSPSTTTTPSTTTYLPAADATLLDPKKLTLADFGAGWTIDNSPDAASTEGAPGCLADLVNVKGSTERTSVVLVGPKSEPADVLQTVALFPPGKAAASAAQLQAEFESCAHDLSDPSQGHSATVTPIDGIDTGEAGFAATMTLTSGSQHGYFDAFYTVKGDVATFVGWYSNSPASSGFEQTAAAALSKL